MRWRLLVGKYGLKIKYIKVSKNALSRPPKQGDVVGDVDAVQPFVPPVGYYIFPVYLNEF